MATYPADQVGSFLRPPELLEARVAQAEGRMSEEQLHKAEDKATLTILESLRDTFPEACFVLVDSVVRLIRCLAARCEVLHVYSDGEYRRGMWMTGLPAAVEGFVPGALLNIRKWRGQPLP